MSNCLFVTKSLVKGPVFLKVQDLSVKKLNKINLKKIREIYTTACLVAERKELPYESW